MGGPHVGHLEQACARQSRQTDWHTLFGSGLCRCRNKKRDNVCFWGLRLNTSGNINTSSWMNEPWLRKRIKRHKASHVVSASLVPSHNRWVCQNQPIGGSLSHHQPITACFEAGVETPGVTLWRHSDVSLCFVHPS